MADDKKRYVVTYAGGESGKEALSETLGIATGDIEDGLAVMASDKAITDVDVLHIDELNTSVVSLTDDQKAQLESRPEVLEVVEDFEMHALDDAYTSNGDDTDLLVSDMPMLAPASPANADQQMYMRGYDDGYRAMQDRLRELVETGKTPDTDQKAPAEAQPGSSAPPIALPPFQPIPWNIQMVKAPAAWNRGIRGDGVKVAILDTGIGPHADLIVSGGASFISGVASFNDDQGHGTHCAGIAGARNNFVGVVGVAPRCRLFAVKVLSATGSGPFSGIVAGLGWALANKMDVVSMSLGATMPCQNAPLALVNAINQLIAAGCVVVAATGNSGQQSAPNSFVGVPGSIKGVIAVAAVNQNKQIAPFSSRGGACNQVTISAPGVSINSTFHAPANSYRALSGTSMACPHVAGGAALIKQRFPGISVAALRAKLVTTATDLGAPGNDPTFGAGLLNCDLSTL
jgi:subtilisin